MVRVTGPRFGHTVPVPRVSPLLDELLARTPFAGEATVRTLAPLFVGKDVPSGTLIFLEGGMEGAFAIVAAGRLRAFRQLAGGQELTVFWLLPGDWFGFLPLLDGGPFPVSVASTETSRLFVLRRDDFQRSMRDDPGICTHLLAYTAGRLRGCLDQLGMLGRPGALPRLAAVLSSLMPPDQSGPVEIDLPISHAELARTIGVAPENLSRAMTRLARDGVVRRVARRRLTVVDPATLRRVAGGDPLLS
jgi:CRP-like cAMP-binding protein